MLGAGLALALLAIIIVVSRAGCESLRFMRRLGRAVLGGDLEMLQVRGL